MEFADSKRICRICLQNDLILDWDEELFKFSGMSFKDCYYKYTQLEETVSDPFPHFLCEACSTDLKSFHLFIEKAIETQKVLEQKLATSFECDDDDLYSKTECVYMVENNDIAPESQATFEDISDEIAEIESIEKEPRGERTMRARKVRNCAKVNLNNSSVFEADSDDGHGLKKVLNQSKSPRKARVSKKPKEIQVIRKQEDEDKESKSKTKAKTPVMCSYCSKIIHNAYYLKKHEQTHKEHRERDVTCSKCGLKSYTKTALYIHMKIHDKNREKTFKCEFCDKAFFHRGACNVHRRIHLGQMVKCPLCPKEFYRQIDLDKHMPSHSHAPLHASKPVSKSKYVVHCKECNKEISSAKFNAHRAAHMNEPLMRCTVCEKDFFSRVSCTRHMGRVHKRAWDNYDDITVYYEKYRPRLSHVLMEQQEEVEAKKG